MDHCVKATALEQAAQHVRVPHVALHKRQARRPLPGKLLQAAEALLNRVGEVIQDGERVAGLQQRQRGVRACCQGRGAGHR